MPGQRVNFRRDSLYLVALAACGLLVMAVFLSQEWRLTGRLDGVPLDDSWIHYRFAENLRDGEGFSFNPGFPTPGSTAPLWVIFLSLLGADFLIPSKIAGITAYLASGILVYLLARRITGSSLIAFFVGLSTLFAGRIAWAAPSGMETTAFTAFSLMVLILWGHTRPGRISPLVSITFGLACLVRPEGYLLLALSFLEVFLGLERSSWKRFFAGAKPFLQHVVISGLVILPYLGFSLLTTGWVFPNTFYAKSAIWGCPSGVRYFSWIGSVFLLDNPVMAALALLGLVGGIFNWRRWRSLPAVRLGAAWLVTLPFFYGVLAPCVSGYYTRYTTPLIPVMMLFAGLGILLLETRLQTWFTTASWPRWQPQSVLLLFRLVIFEGVLLGLLPSLLFWAPYYGYGVADIADMHLKMGRWLAENSQAGEVLALNDIGAIGSLADREVIDLMGLASPEVLGLIDGKGPGQWDGVLADHLSSRRPDFLVIFPNWFPGLASQLPASPVFAVRLPAREIAGLPGITVAGGGEMVVYRLDWSGKR